MNVLIMENFKTSAVDEFTKCDKLNFRRVSNYNAEAIILDTRKINLYDYQRLKVI